MSDKSKAISKYRLWSDQLASIEDKEQQRKWIHATLRYKEHEDIFGRYFFPHIIQGTDEVPECHLDLIRELTSPHSSAIIFPRGFAKTTWEKIDTLHDIVYGIEPVILYISATITEAQFHFESIKVELENNEALRYVYGNLVPPEWVVSRKWTNKHFETTNGVNVVARSRNKGRGINIKNMRPTKAIGDDLEDDEQVRSVEQRQKLHDWIYNVIIPSLHKEKGRLKLIGTVLHPKAEVLDFYNNYGGIFRQAIEGGHSIWPTRFTIEDLYRIRDGYTDETGKKIKGIGTRAFNQEYQNMPTADELAKIAPAWLNSTTFTPEMLPNDPMEKIIYIDPQAGESGMADEFAITCLGWFRKSEHRYVLEQVAGRKSQLEQAKEMIRMWLRHNKRVKALAVEKVLNQTAVYQTLADWKAGRIDFNTKDISLGHPEWIDESDRNIPLVGVQPRGKDGGKLKDKVARLEMHEPSFERGEIHIQAHMTELRDQICFLGTKMIDHDDRADSLVGALDLSYKNISIDNSSTFVENKKKEYTTTVAGNLMKKKF